MTFLSAVQPANVSSLIAETLDGISISLNFTQPLKAPAPIESSFAGSIILSSAIQSLNTLSPIDKRSEYSGEKGSVTFDNAVQPANALSPIDSAELKAKLMLLREEQFSNAWAPTAAA